MRAGHALVVALGGLDPTGGAGLVRDRLTLARAWPEVAWRGVVTAWTQQGDGQPARARPVSAQVLARVLAGLPRPAAVKLGLVPTGLVEVVASYVGSLGVPVVLDPVLRASDGGDLGADASSLLKLAQHVTLVTPNRLEAAALTGREVFDPGLGAALHERLPHTALLLKDGHGADPTTVCDEWWLSGGCVRLTRGRVRGPDVRGTGCALAAAITGALAVGISLAEAVPLAVGWLDEARQRTVLGPDGRFHLWP